MHIEVVKRIVVLQWCFEILVVRDERNQFVWKLDELEICEVVGDGEVNGRGLLGSHRPRIRYYKSKMYFYW